MILCNSCEMFYLFLFYFYFLFLHSCFSCSLAKFARNSTYSVTISENNTSQKLCQSVFSRYNVQYTDQNRGGGYLYLKLDIILVKKNHVIRVIFQDQAMYVSTLFRGAKTYKIGKKGCVFCHIDIFWKGHDGKIKKNACKNAYLGSIFHT